MSRVVVVPCRGRFVHTLVLSLSKDERCCSWFDELTTSEGVLY